MTVRWITDTWGGIAGNVGAAQGRAHHAGPSGWVTGLRGSARAGTPTWSRGFGTEAWRHGYRRVRCHASVPISYGAGRRSRPGGGVDRAAGQDRAAGRARSDSGTRQAAGQARPVGGMGQVRQQHRPGGMGRARPSGRLGQGGMGQVRQQHRPGGGSSPAPRVRPPGGPGRGPGCARRRRRRWRADRCARTRW